MSKDMSVGEVRKAKGLLFIAVKNNGCDGCYFEANCTAYRLRKELGFCSSLDRVKHRDSIVFVLVEREA